MRMAGHRGRTSAHDRAGQVCRYDVLDLCLIDITKGFCPNS